MDSCTSRDILPSALVLVCLTACAPDPEVPEEPEPTLSRADLGTLGSDAEGLSAALTFEVTEETTSTAVHCGPLEAGLAAAAWSLKGPGGAVVHTHPDHPEGTTGSLRSDAQPLHFALQLPMTPELPLDVGTWSLELRVVDEAGTPAAGASLACAQVSRISPVRERATLRLELVLSSDTLDAAAAEEDEALGEALDAAAALLDQAGVAVEVTGFVDGPSQGELSFTAADPAALGLLVASARAEAADSVAVVLVDNISVDGLELPTSSAGTPGLPTEGGTARSGLVLSLAQVDFDADYAGLHLAQELGHLLGLFHTSDRRGNSHDVLEDTPTCTDAEGDGTISPTDCVGKGAANLMFWSPLPSSEELSEDQAWVLMRSPAIP